MNENTIMTFDELLRIVSETKFYSPIIIDSIPPFVAYDLPPKEEKQPQEKKFVIERAIKI